MPPQDKWEQYAAPPKADEWDKYATGGTGRTDNTTPEIPGFFARLAQSSPIPIPTSTEELKSLAKSVAMLAANPIMAGRKMAVDYSRNLGGAVRNEKQQYAEARQNIREGGPVLANIGKMGSADLNTALQAVPIIGPSIQTAGEDVYKKNYAGAAGGLTGVAAQLALPKIIEAAPKADRAITSAREAVGTKIHTPEGALTPGAEQLARGAGAAVGGTVGAATGSVVGPYGTYAGAGIGTTTGALLGPSLMERMFPEAKSAVEARARYDLAKTITEAQDSAIRTNKAFDTAAARKAAQLEKQARDAADEAIAARDQHAQDLMDRQAAQDKLDAAAAKATNAAARNQRQMEAAHAKAIKEIEKARQADLGSAEKLKNQHAEDLMRRQKEQDALDKTAQEATQDASDARDQHAQDLMERQKQQDALDKKAVLAAREAAKHRPTAKLHLGTRTPTGDLPQGNPTPFGQDLISRMRKIVLPGEEPSAADLKRAGDLTQVPLPKLKTLASWGDELAKNEINRRLRNQ